MTAHTEFLDVSPDQRPKQFTAEAGVESLDILFSVKLICSPIMMRVRMRFSRHAKEGRPGLDRVA